MKTNKKIFLNININVLSKLGLLFFFTIANNRQEKIKTICQTSFILFQTLIKLHF